jgi:hypothetical protein
MTDMTPVVVKDGGSSTGVIHGIIAIINRPLPSGGIS